MKGYLGLLAVGYLGGCATTVSPGQEGAAALVVPGAQLEHEVLVWGPDRRDVLRGVLSFTSSAGFSLTAFTPFGMDLFELSRSQGKFHYKAAKPLAGKLPLKAMARDVWRIYFAACPKNPCEFDGAQVSQQMGPSGRLQQRTFRDDNGRAAVVDYRNWQAMQDILHPQTIELTSGEWGLRIHAVGFVRPEAVSSTKR